MAADLAVFGARIRTMDPERPFASAMAVTGGVITAVGSDDEVRAVCDATTEMLSGEGRTVTPGLTDGHQHLVHGSQIARGVNFDRLPDLPSVTAALDAERRRLEGAGSRLGGAGNRLGGAGSRLGGAGSRLGPGGWILGYALEYAAFGGRAYHHDLVDAATGEHPMLVYSLDLHTGFTNAAGLRIAGVDGPRAFPDGSSIVCDESGKPTGELRERSAIDTVRTAMAKPGTDQQLEWVRDAIAHQNAVGLTGIHQMDGDAETIEVLQALEAAGALNLRVALHRWIGPKTPSDAIDEFVNTRPAGRLWHAGGVKFMIDGVIETGTAWLEEPDTHGGGGDPMWPDPEEYRRAVTRCHEGGLRIATHAIGDRAVREVLDTYGSLKGGSARHRIEHIETAPDKTVARFRPQGVTASMQPIHMRWMKPDLSDPWSDRLGAARCAHCMPSGDLSAAGALVVLGSDWPVAPYDPRLGFYAAQARRAPDKPEEGPIGASRPLSAEATLAGYTTNAALAIGQQDVAGALKPGYQADFVVWGDDPVTCPLADVTELPVHATVVDGRVVHRAD